MVPGLYLQVNDILTFKPKFDVSKIQSIVRPVTWRSALQTLQARVILIDSD